MDSLHPPLHFRGRSFYDFGDWFEAVDIWQHTFLVLPLTRKLDALAPKYKRQFHELLESFQDGASKHDLDSSRPAAAGFTISSEKRDAGQALRRFAFATQARGLRIHIREAPTMLKHIEIAKTLSHPCTNLHEALEPAWRSVFKIWERSSETRGIRSTYTAICRHRERALTWIEHIASDLQPIQRECRATMPPMSRLVAGHLNLSLFYMLLKVTDYPNPELAFRPFIGAPLAGTFYSPALAPRVMEGLPFTSENLRYIASKCQAQVYTVRKSLSPEGGMKSMEKMDKEFASKTLVGPFRNQHALFLAINEEICKHTGLTSFSIWDFTDFVVISPQFSVEELHAYQEQSDAADGEVPVTATPKIRNICNEKTLNDLATTYCTYIPNTHGDVAAILMRWLSMFRTHCSPFLLLGWPSDFTGAYRQMPLTILHILLSATVYWDYRDDKQKYAYYRSLPFGSTIAPAAWSEVVVALAHLMAKIFIAIITHCVDDVCNIEPDTTVHSARKCFLSLVKKIGFVLDMEKSIAPCEEFIYLGLKLLLPAAIPRRKFTISIPDARRTKLLMHLEKIVHDNFLSPGDASSMRGRLYFYAFWNQEARGFLAELAARQYSQSKDFSLSSDLLFAINFFRQLLNDPVFLKGISPEEFFDRTTMLLYTDGSFEGDDIVKPMFKGIGGVLFTPESDTPYVYEEVIRNSRLNFAHIAVIEMHAIYRALQLFRKHVRGSALILFCDNTHAIGCLLKRSASVRENEERRKISHGFVDTYHALSMDIRRCMNFYARRIWRLVTELDIILWIEYVNTKLNIADLPSRAEKLPFPAIAINQ